MNLPEPPRLPFRLDYGSGIEAEIGALQRALVAAGIVAGGSPRWLAVKLVEGDTKVLQNVARRQGGLALVNQARVASSRLVGIFGDQVDTLLADRRYGWINALVQQAVVRPVASVGSISDRGDQRADHQLGVSFAGRHRPGRHLGGEPAG